MFLLFFIKKFISLLIKINNKIIIYTSKTADKNQSLINKEIYVFFIIGYADEGVGLGVIFYLPTYTVLERLVTFPQKKSNLRL